MASRCVAPEVFARGLWMTVDPGVTTAWQTWENGKPCQHGNGVIRLDSDCKNEPIERRVAEMGRLFFQRMCGCRFDGVIIEGIRVMSFTSAVSGSLFIPAYLIGAYCYIAESMRQKYYLLDPNWRGQLNEEAMRNILQIKFNYIAKNEHLADVYGMGQWLLGKF